MQKVAVLLRPAQPRGVQGDSPLQILELAPDAAEGPVQVTPLKSATPISLAPSPARNAPVTPAAPVNRASPPALSPQAIDDILEFELTPDVPAPALRSQTQRLPALGPVNGADLSLNLPSEKPAGKPISAVPVAAVVPVVAAPAPSPQQAAFADSLDLQLPSIDSPASTVFAGNVAPFPSPTPAASGTSAAVNGAAVPQAAPAAPIAPVNGSATSTSKILGTSGTGTAKVLAATTGTSAALGATTTSRVLTLPDGISLFLEVQPFTKLRTGGRTRRYEVLARSSQPNRSPPGLDKIALQQLLTWMGSNRTAWNSEPTSFTLNLSIATLEDERFPQFVASNLKTHGIAPDNLGFEIAEPLCLQRRAQVERFITLCDKLGCFVVIDDFSLDSSIVSLLRSKALRLVKIDPKLTSVALKDKLAQAMVVAIAQAVKVLGIHCAACDSTRLAAQ
jgi:EAL domain-containing protein (putative c-di-GMP-specific phosphodiesterase class I)